MQSSTFLERLTKEKIATLRPKFQLRAEIKARRNRFLEDNNAPQAERAQEDLLWLDHGIWRFVYADDPISFIENECWISNPDHPNPREPFQLWPFQRTFITEIHQAFQNRTERGVDLLSEKSRQMGTSWLLMAFYLWGVTFLTNFSGFAMSYKEGLVDDGGENSTIDSLFGRLRFMYQHLRSDIRQPLLIRSLRIENKRTGSYIVGESTNSNAGRGGSYAIGVWDETASTPKSETIYGAFQQAVRCRIYNSTVRGKGNVFSRLRWEVPGVRVVTLHWSEHPERVANLRKSELTGRWTSDWYEAQERILTAEQVAQELDIDYEVSARGRIYNKLNRQTHQLKLTFNPDWETVLAWDLGIADETFCAVMQKDNQGAVGIVDEVFGEDEDIRFYIELLHGYVPDEVEHLPKERREMYEGFAARAGQRVYRQLVNVAGPDVTQRGIQSKRSVRAQFARAGLLNDEIVSPNGGNGYRRKRIARRYQNLRMIPITGFSVLDGIAVVRKLMNPQHCRFAVAEHCVYTWERLMNYKWAQTADDQNKQTPEHDWASHGADAVRYGSLFFERKRKILAKPSGL